MNAGGRAGTTRSRFIVLVSAIALLSVAGLGLLATVEDRGLSAQCAAVLGPSSPLCSGLMSALDGLRIVSQAVRDHGALLLGILVLAILSLGSAIHTALRRLQRIGEHQLAALQASAHETRTASAAIEKTFQELSRAYLSVRLSGHRIHNDPSAHDHPAPLTVTLSFEMTNQGRSRARVLRVNPAVRVNNAVNERGWTDQPIWLTPGETFSTSYTFEIPVSPIVRTKAGERVPILASLGLVYGDAFRPDYPEERFCWSIAAGEPTAIPETIFDARAELAAVTSA